MASPHTCVALLRGINVGGRNRLKMADLVRVCEALGWRDVVTVIQSGNVVFDPPAPSSGSPTTQRATDQMACSLVEALRSLELDVHTLVRPWRDVRAAIEATPFQALPDTDGKADHLFLLAARAKAGAQDALQSLCTPTESVAVNGRYVYLRAPEGIARSKLAVSIERGAGCAATARSWRTLQRIAEVIEQRAQSA